VHDHPRRLVYDDQVVVLVDDGKRQRLGLRLGVHGLRDVDADFLTDPHRVVGFDVPAGDLYLSVLDEALNLRSRLVRQHRGEKPIEPDTLAFLWHRQRHAALFRAVFGAGAPARAR